MHNFSLRSLWQISGVAVRDYIHDVRLSSCSILGLAAVLAPVLVLYGLKFGVVSTMVENLNNDPAIREIKILGQGEYRVEDLDAFSNLPGASFLIPNTRFLSATLDLSSAKNTNQFAVRSEMVPSTRGDPLLPTEQSDGPSGNNVYLSAALAAQLNVQVDDHVTGKIVRVANKKREAVRLDLVVQGILPLSTTQRKLLLVSLDLLLAAEDYREGFAVPSMNWEGLARDGFVRSYASFRLFAATMDDVEALRAEMASRGIETKTQLDRIEMVRTFDRNLTALFLIISSLALFGYALAMIVSVIASVARKQKDISILKLLGFSDLDVAMLPILQSILTTVGGSVLAIILYFLASEIINRNFATGLQSGEVLCLLLPHHYLIAVGASVCLGGLVSVVGGFSAASVMPAEGVRND
ncbi:FtsX-like permease family protein [uncultured Thalassospira sp.]|uniref:ABC transporter permease n=1 Tax=uncultured Thalassospira sp. TaxID=404382 RepID=UPI0030DB8FF8|tara:strand:- start:10128 stop:11360 length:1233 start_codon:yes stop_codon:yes gene_type:complete